MRVALVDYGAGNLRSASRALQAAGATPHLATGPEGLRGAEAIVVPGVGAFAPAMARLTAADLVAPLREAASAGIPLVGICLGMQLLFEESDEGGRDEGVRAEGLGVIAGRVRRLAPGVKVPHMGWNTLEIRRSDPLFYGLPKPAHVYFVHSYVVAPADANVVVAETVYGERFPAVVRHGRVWGTQFHPEKSSLVGARFLRNLLALVASERRPS